MSEESQKSEAIAGLADPVALGMAISRSSHGMDDELTAYLRDQRHHLHEQLKQLHLDIWEKWLGVFLRAATAVVGVAFAGALAYMVWEAAHSNGLLVEPFSVPAEMAERGLTGQVMAARVLDRLLAMQADTNTGRPARSYANSWGEHAIKLDIPETGISLNELDNFLRAKLGNDTRVGGEIVRSPSGITLTARAGEEGAVSVSGQDADLDALVAKLAEQLYGITQPYRYAMYLATHDHADKAVPRFSELALRGSPQDRVWAYNMWGNWTPDITESRRLLIQAVAAYPDAIGARDNLGSNYFNYSQPEQALVQYRRELANWSVNIEGYTNTANGKRRAQSRIDIVTGAYHDASPVWAEFAKTGLRGFNAAAIATPLSVAQIGEHDLAGARETMAPYTGLRPVITRLQIEAAAGNWAAVMAQQNAVAAQFAQSATGRTLAPRTILPLVAMAKAGLGDLAGAEAVIARTPADCDVCLRTRGKIAELRGQHDRADFWFAKALAFSPSIPFAEIDWGVALLGRSQPDKAIEKFVAANKKSPHFADALEGWGESLMAKRQSHLALEKFAEAEKYAPNWGRLHLKWGEALYYAGKKEDAKAQFARAATLDLTPAEKAELARHP